MDGTEFGKTACEWVKDNLLRKEDIVVLVTVWEQAMVEKLFAELDAEIIHPDVEITHSRHNQLNDTFETAKCLTAHGHLTALLVEAGARNNPKNIGEEIVTLAKNMNT